ncbi:MAG TPA: DUF4097 family beta strand repeat-containing protein [Acidobacteriota bacterium]|nr:DUF4097 family beta strand repeat-containing protein [Acidobacteriota bacterium]
MNIKKSLFAVAFIATAAFAAGAAQRASARHDLTSFKTETISRTLKLADPAKPGEVIVDNVWGSIKVEASAGREVLLEAKKTVFARDEARAKKAEEEVKLDITEKGNTVEAYVDGPFRDDSEGRLKGGVHMRRDPGYEVAYAFTLKVPARTNLVLSTVLDGDVEVRGVEGTFDVRNVVGEVRLVDAAGSGEARAVSGGVTVVFKRAPDGPCSFGTVSGDVEVDFPGVPSADFRIKTMNGEVYSDFDVTYLPKAPPVREERREKDGTYVYKSRGGYGVRTGKGGPEIQLETLTGDILIAKRSKSTS